MRDDLNYGPILITKGQHKGKIGYFDDTILGLFRREAVRESEEFHSVLLTISEDILTDGIEAFDNNKVFTIKIIILQITVDFFS